MLCYTYVSTQSDRVLTTPQEVRFMALDERKLKILDAIVKEYIQTAEPVGSRTLSKNPAMNMSPATIRNEMADLEEMGYLFQPHTSAGRVPSEKAYRLYVDQLMKIIDLGNILQEEIKSAYNKYINEFSKVIEYTAQLLSQITNYTSFGMTPHTKYLNCKYIKLIPIDEKRILMVIVTKEKIIRNYNITLENETTDEQIEKINNVLNICLKDISLSELNNHIIEKMDSLSVEELKLLEEIIPLLREALSEKDIQTVYADGMDKIFNFPEFFDIERAKRFIETLNQQNILANILEDNTKDLNIQIGGENTVKAFKDCSLITATYKINGKPIGTFGVVGPTRMNYDYVVSVLNFLREELNAQIIRNITQ